MEFIVIIYLIVVMLSIYLYSLFLLLLFKNRKELFTHSLSKKNLPTVSVLIPAYNEEKAIAKTIQSVLNQNYPKDKMEIIVLNDGSIDDTEKIAKSFEQVKVITKQNTGKANTLNYGISIAKGELIAVVDADSYHEKDSLLQMINCFKEDKNIEAVTSAIRPRNTNKILGKLQYIEYTMVAYARKLFEFINSIYVTPGPLSIYKKKTLQKLKGFDPKNMTEDIEITWRLLRNKFKVKMCLGAKVYTTVPQTFKKWWHQRIRWNIGVLQTFAKHRDVLARRGHGMLGVWVAPFYLSSFILAFTGFLLFAYIFGKKLFSKSLLYFYSISTNSVMLQLKQLHLTPSIFMIFGVLLLTLYLTYTTIGLKIMDPGKIPTKRKATILLYMFFYLSLYPLIFLHSLYIFFTNKGFKW